MKVFINMLIFLLIISKISADEIHVSTEPELVEAVWNLKSGDLIFIEPGEYILTSTLVINNKPEKIYDVIIKGVTGNRNDVKVFCPGMGVYSSSAPHVFAIYNVERLTIQDLTCGKTYWHPITVQGNYGADSPIFRNLRLIDAGEQFIKINNKDENKCDNGLIENCLLEYTDYAYWDGDKYYTQGIDKIGGGDNWTLRGNVIKNIRPHPEHLAQAGGCGAAITFWQGGKNNIIERNVIINCRKGIELGISDGTGVEGGIVRNNFVFRAAGEAGGDTGILVNDTPEATVVNNTVILNGTFDPGNGPRNIEFRFDGSTGLEMNNNLSDGGIWARTNGLNPDIDNNILNAEADWFVDVENADLHITSNAAPAIDMGLSLESVEDDIDGHSRPAGNAYDIGADEYGSTENSVEEISTFDSEIRITPNPISENSMIEFYLEKAAKVEICVYSLEGRILHMIQNGIMAAGFQKIPFRLNKLNMGMYICQVIIDGKTGKYIMIVVPY